MDQREILSFEVVTDDRTEAGTEPLGKRAGRLLEVLRAHVVGRGVDEIAREGGSLGHARDGGDVDIGRRHQPHVCRVDGAITSEPIAA